MNYIYFIKENSNPIIFALGVIAVTLIVILIVDKISKDDEARKFVKQGFFMSIGFFLFSLLSILLIVLILSLFLYILVQNT